MSKGNLKKVVRDHVEEKSLSETQLDSLLQIQNSAVSRKPIKAKEQYRWFAIASVLLIAVANGVYFSTLENLELDQRIGSEVAKNHLNLKPLEIQTSSIQEIRGFLSQLGFSPIESSLLAGSTKTLMGGRYCSIQGVRAAQLRLKDSKTGQIQSLYQTVYDKDVFYDLPLLIENQKPITVFSKGLAVDIWVEKGLLFALTREVNK